LPSAPEREIMAAPRAGYLAKLDAEIIGRASGILGAGRDRVDDRVDPGVGIVVLAKPGDRLSAGQPVLELHFRDPGKRDAAAALASRAIVISDAQPQVRAILLGEVL